VVQLVALVQPAEPLHILLFLLLMMRMVVSLGVCSPNYLS
jgi:hypothetical protein